MIEYFENWNYENFTRHKWHFSLKFLEGQFYEFSPLKYEIQKFGQITIVLTL